MIGGVPSRAPRPVVLGEGHPLKHILRVRTNWATGNVEIVGSLGRSVRAQLFEPPAESPSIVESTFDTSTSSLTLTLVTGATATMQVGDAPPSVDRPVVYLDQVHWIRLAQFAVNSQKQMPPGEREAAEELTALADSGELILPLSSAHVVEAAKKGGSQRVDLAVTMTRLSQGWQMRSPLSLRKAELAWVLDKSRLPSHGAVRNWLFSLEPGVIWSPSIAPVSIAEFGPDLSRLVQRISALHSLFEVLLEPDPCYSQDGIDYAQAWANSLSELAAHMQVEPKARKYRREISRARFLGDIQVDVAQVAASIGVQPAAFKEWITSGIEDSLQRAPSLLRIRELFDLRLANGSDKWEGNDLNDMMYLCSAAGYADVVVGERKTINLMRRSKNVSGGAAICSKLSEALPLIHALRRQEQPEA